jgi:hypothetical protein
VRQFANQNVAPEEQNLALRAAAITQMRSTEESRHVSTKQTLLPEAPDMNYFAINSQFIRDDAAGRTTFPDAGEERIGAGSVSMESAEWLGGSRAQARPEIDDASN